MKKQAPVQEASKALAPQSHSSLPVVTQGASIMALLEKHNADEDLKSQVLEVIDNLALLENPSLPKIKVTAAGIVPYEGADPVEEMEVVILHGRKYNSYYKKAYKAGSIERPDCFSHDGKVPDSSVEKPQGKDCKSCPQAQWATNAMGQGKACRQMRRLFVLTGDDNIMPAIINVTPTSLKSIESYLSKLVMRGSNMAKVRTKITAKLKQQDDKYCVLGFEDVKTYKAATPEDAKFINRVQCIKNVWLSLMDAQTVDVEDFSDAPTEESEAATNQAPKGDF